MSRTEFVTWHDVTDGLPDSDETVLLHMPDDDTPVWPGYHDGEQWLLADGAPAPDVVRWAAMPTGEAT